MNSIKRKILIVDDEEVIRTKIENCLKDSNFDVISVENGQIALDYLKNTSEIIDVIISDIKMPVMNGYDFFAKITENPKYFEIPFIFLTAKGTPEDIRFGKLLGADDYLVKPFNNDDLLASIQGKLKIKERRMNIANQIEEKILAYFDDKIGDVLEVDADKPICVVFLTVWDELEGPKVIKKYSEIKEFPFSLDEISQQLFQTLISIFGSMSNISTQGILLNLKNIDRQSYIYFDSIDDGKVRGGKRAFMLSVIAPKINYLNSLKIEQEFRKYSQYLVEDLIEIDEVYNNIKNILNINSI